jgi:hypothetical protein
VSRTAYYVWLKSHEAFDETRALVKAAEFDKFYFHKRTYDSRRLSDKLKEEGGKVGRYLTRRIMSEERLVAKCPRAYRPRTTDSKETKRRAALSNRDYPLASESGIRPWRHRRRLANHKRIRRRASGIRPKRQRRPGPE